MDDIRQAIQDLLKKLPDGNLNTLKELFWNELNYTRQNVHLDIREWPDEIKQTLANQPILFASAGENDGFHILLFKLNQPKLNITPERQIVNRTAEDHPFALYLFTNQDQSQWHFVHIKQEKGKEQARNPRKVLRRISVSRADKLRTATERITLLDLAAIPQELLGIPLLRIQQQHNEAFDVEKVTDAFFSSYKALFKKLQETLVQQFDKAIWAHDYALQFLNVTEQKDIGRALDVWAHDYALQFLNRLMFLYFIQRKCWLGDDPVFLYNFWKSYKRSERPVDSFVKEWLFVLYFEAFNNRFAAGRADRDYLPEPIRNALQMAPYLNGGLFERNPLDTEFTPVITDAQISEIIEFLEQYNFTISEDTPLDQEVAVDPEMIGKVYESLVNVSAEVDEQGDVGIFYTPRIEIDLMCRLSLVDWLTNHLGKEHKAVFYEMVFAYDPEDKRVADAKLAELGLWQLVYELLVNISVLDPACGSGSFLVGMLMILDDLIARAEAQLGKHSDPYTRRKRIIGSSLYGVDVMGWAVHVAELRLWLQLVIDTDIDIGKLTLEPLLPNLSFKIRRGDSLVQEIGGLNLGLNRHELQISGSVKKELKDLRSEKLRFYNNDPLCKYQGKEQLAQAERGLFYRLLESAESTLVSRKRNLEAAIRPQKNLFGEVQDPQMRLESVQKQRELESVQEELIKITNASHLLAKQKELPFVWEIAFVEIFESENDGFDVVIGNPPYVRQERIHDPELPPENVTTENKREYKEKLARSVYAAWPQTFGYKPGSGTAAWKLDKKSDYYIYFYFDGLKLVNSKGVFCLITSNSWLDVGYGADLQQFLLTRGKVKYIIDNQVKRSFKTADVNTIIALLAPPDDAKSDLPASLAHPARFVMFLTPFEYALNPVVWEEMDGVEKQKVMPEYRLVVRKQKELLESGMDPEKGVYAGDKWGGKYLRAPDIYWVIMEKAKDKLVRLGDVADVRFGIKTGANEFFHLDDNKVNRWGIEKEFLRPILLSTKEIDTIKIDNGVTTHYAFCCNKPKRQLIGTRALTYIEWGEEEGYHNRPSCKNRRFWYEIPKQEKSSFIIFRFRDKRNWTPIILDDEFLIGDTVFVGSFTNQRDTKIGGLILNSAFTILMSEIYGRINLGEGLLTTYGPEIKQMPLINPGILEINTRLEDLFDKLCIRPVLPIYDELKRQDRFDFDSYLLSLIGVSETEVQQIYESIIDFVKKRSERANSLT